MKFFYILILLLVFIGCKDYNSENSLRLISDKSIIYEKETVIKKDHIEVDNSRIESINGVQYIVEEKAVYDKNGILYLLTAGSEGFIVHSRNQGQGTLPIENPERYNRAKISRLNNYIIDNQDTIKKFKILLKDRMILTTPNENNIIYIYKFK